MMKKKSSYHSKVLFPFYGKDFVKRNFLKIYLQTKIGHAGKKNSHLRYRRHHCEQ